ncbi:MAG: DUF3298 and DUF4163 domain-containing protein [Ignavibacteriota bacterium]|mgnify:CR=1 FL=1|nr:DUF3298/DUF4163 domain-containing protein [Ignavibacteriota bacterium]MBW7842335.1 DUF3298 and DUF4163 domain-containing protein [Ignavibacterium sp.]MCO6447005.1 DUF3298 and DUF4163 domain-containing protein [Ignavibacterium album]MCZ2268885.1 DUF3298 and DUF4163 domain-containing protein [Ignavibacteriales bacterium]HMN18309.1 DUF3298 and DUF4163 domain-containing protein [Ignavibacteriaceae bacterium]
MKSLTIILSAFIFCSVSYPVLDSYSAADSVIIESRNYSNSKSDSSIWINIDYPFILNVNNSEVINRINIALEDEFKQSIAWYNEMVSDTTVFFDEQYPMQYSFETGFEVFYNSKDFVSIVLNHYQFTGGAHGNYFAVGYNINLSDGSFLSLADIVQPGKLDLLAYECEEAILEKYQANSLFEAGLFENEIVISEDQDFYIIPGALVLQFDPYEIGPYAMGEITAEISFDKIKDILSEDLPFSTE